MFDRTILINLDKRTDRLGAFKAKIINIPELQGFTRFRAIHGDSVGVPGFFTAGGGAYGCRQSHVTCLQDAMLDGIQSLLILEDDCLFCPDFSGRLREFMAVVPDDWQLLMLGGQNHGHPPGETGVHGVLRSVNTQRTHAYAIRGHEAMRDLYKLWMRCTTHIDHWFGQFQARHACYQPDPFLIGQDSGPSDISGRQDSVRFWSPGRVADSNADEIAVLHTDRKIAERLRMLGLHYGNDRCQTTGRDRGLIRLESLGWPKDGLNAWADLIVGEALESGDIPALWHHPAPPANMVANSIRRPVRDVRAATVDEAIAAIPEIEKSYRQSQAIWCWKGADIETMEGVGYYGFHRGFHRDPITGLDQGLRRIIAGRSYKSLRPLVNQLRQEASSVKRGKVMLAHPDLDVDAVRSEFPNDRVLELNGSTISDVLASFTESCQ